MKKRIILFWSAVLILVSIRGALIYHFGLNPDTTYAVSALLLVCFGLISFKNILYNPVDKSLEKLKNAVIINFYLLSFYFITVSIFQGTITIGVVYEFAIFPIIFTIIRYNKFILEGIVHLIAIITAFGVFLIFLIGQTKGYYELIHVIQIFRGEVGTVSRIGKFLLPFGYQGSNHDAANILAMCSIFYLYKVINIHGFNRLIYIVMFSVLFFIVLLTGSASNIVIMIAFIGVMIMISANTLPRKIAVISCITLASFLILHYYVNVVDLLYFTNKFISQDKLAGGGILNSLDAKSIFFSSFSILFGFGYLLEVPLIHSEVAFIKLLVGFGFFPFLILMFVIFSPIYYIYIFKKASIEQSKKNPDFQSSSSSKDISRDSRVHLRQLIFLAMPVLCGAITLVHYGSLFRVTSIGLFCVFMALFFRQICKMSH